jgi:hypothetical protein
MSSSTPPLPSGPAVGGLPGTPCPTPTLAATPAPRVNALPDEGNFKMALDWRLLSNMYETLTRLKLWDWLANKTDPMDENSAELAVLLSETEAGLNKPSFDMCMKHMDCIAKKGWAEYCRTLMFMGYIDLNH